MSKPIIIALFPIQPTISNFSYLNENFTVINYSLSTRDAFIKDIQTEPYSAASAIFGSYPGFASIGGLKDKVIIDALPASLKIIGLSSAGFDGYTLQLLADRGIKLCNVPVDIGVGMDVADCALWHVLSGIRKFNNWDRVMHNTPNAEDQHTLKVRDSVRNESVKDESAKEHGFAFGHMFHGNPITRVSKKKCAMFGYGLIGKLVVKRMLTIGLDVHVLVRDKQSYKDVADGDGVTIYSSQDQQDVLAATKDANVIIVCLPGGPQTQNIVNSKILQNVSDDSVIVNVGRGSCIDTEALKSAIETGKISHVGLDVFPSEPVVERYWFDEHALNSTSNPYFTSSLTPHLGSATIDTFEFATEANIRNIINAIENDTYSNAVN